MPILEEKVIAGSLAQGTKFALKHRGKILLWVKKQSLKLFPANFNLALSIEFKDGLNSGKYFNEIKKRLLQAVSDTGLSNQIKLKDFSDIYKFPDQKEAEKFRQKKDIDLIIWGSFSEDGLKREGELINKVTLNFTYGHPDTKDRRIGKMVLADIDSRMARKNYWEIIDKQSFDDIVIISNNIFDIAIYIMALTQKLYGKVGKSLGLFERLYNNLSAREDDFRKLVIPHILDCYQIVIIDEGIHKKNYATGKEYCLKHLKLFPDNDFALSNLASFYYRLGEKKEAEKTAELLLKLYPNNPITEFDIAFIRTLQGNYKNAFKHYCKLSQLQQINFNPLEMVEFLHTEYKDTKEPALLYGSGVVGYHFGGDKELAKKDFKKFLSKADEVNYKSMYRQARRLVKKVNIISSQRKKRVSVRNALIKSNNN